MHRHNHDFTIYISFRLASSSFTVWCYINMQKCSSSTVIIVDNNFSAAPSSTSVLSRDPCHREGFKPLPLPHRVVVGGIDNPQITPLGCQPLHRNPRLVPPSPLTTRDRQLMSSLHVIFHLLLVCRDPTCVTCVLRNNTRTTWPST